MVNKKNGGGKKRGGDKSPAPPRGPVNRASGLSESGNVSTQDQEKTHDQVTESEIISLTGALVNWTARLTLATIVLGVIAFFQWRALVSTDEHVGEQVKITAGQLEEMRNAQRAWIALTSIEIGGPLDFGGEKASVQINLVLKNVGNKPAVHTNVFLNLNPQRLTFDGLDPPSFCPEGIPLGDFGYTLFPSASTEEYKWFPKAWSASGSSQNPKASQFETFEYFVSGCITYESAGDASPHSTRFAAQLTPSKVFPLSKGPRNRYEPAEITLSVMPAGHYAN